MGCEKSNLCSVERDKPDDLQTLGQGMQHNLSPSVKGVFRIMANAIINAKSNANEINAANAATATPAPVAEQKEQQTAQTSRRRRSTTPRCGG